MFKNVLEILLSLVFISLNSLYTSSTVDVPATCDLRIQNKNVTNILCKFKKTHFSLEQRHGSDAVQGEETRHVHNPAAFLHRGEKRLT